MDEKRESVNGRQGLSYQELFLLLLRRLVIEPTSLNDLVVDIKLVSGSSIHSFYHTLLRNETQNAHGLCLTDTMRTILSLEIGVWIPIRVETINLMSEIQNMHIQISSYMMTVSADCKFKPRPPALVDKMKT